MAEADKLAQEKQRAEVEVERLKRELEAREHSVADEALISQALLNFEELYQHMPFEDRARLMALLIRRVTVTKIDLPDDESQSAEDGKSGSIRTQAYQVTFDFFIKSLFSAPSETFVKRDPGSYFSAGGGEGGIRTPETIASLLDFESSAINRALPPLRDG